jgi:hypothetical protein
MNEKERLLLALQQINNITSLLQDNKYKNYLYSNLITIEVELQRQLTNLTYHERRQFQESNGKYVDDPKQQRSQLSNSPSTN